jgi:AsmA protein
MVSYLKDAQMGRLTKIILGLVAAFVALFAVAAIAFFLFFDPNDFREDIAKAVKESTGRELTNGWRSR